MNIIVMQLLCLDLQNTVDNVGEGQRCAGCSG